MRLYWKIACVLFAAWWSGGCEHEPEVHSAKGVSKPTGGQAFPMHYGTAYQSHAGMEMRDYFAAHAPPRMPKSHDDGTDAELEAKWRWEYADEMLRQR